MSPGVVSSAAEAGPTQAAIGNVLPQYRATTIPLPKATIPTRSAVSAPHQTAREVRTMVPSSRLNVNWACQLFEVTKLIHNGRGCRNRCSVRAQGARAEGDQSY